MKRLLLLFIVPFLSFGQCVDGDFDNDGICDEIDDCVGTWIPDIVIGNCSQFTSQGADACNSYSGCEWTYSWGGWVTGGSSDCVGSYEIDNGYCDELELLINGCVDESACNYDELANQDDGSCQYPGDVCEEVECVMTGSGAPTIEMITLSVLDNDCNCVQLLGCMDPEACNYIPTATSEFPFCSLEPCLYAGGSGAVFMMLDDNGEFIPTTNCEEISEECECCYLGNMDNDGNIFQEYICGCLDEDALNYDSNAILSNNSCIYESVNISEKINNKNLINTIDILGRETNNKDFQLHIYDDGSVEKNYLIK